MSGLEGLVAEEPILAPTRQFRLEDLDVDLNVWSGTVDIAVPVWANSHLIDLFKVTGGELVRLDITVRYQACSDRACLVPRTENLRLEVPVEPLDVPSIPDLGLDGQRITRIDSLAHVLKLLDRFG